MVKLFKLMEKQQFVHNIDLFRKEITVSVEGVFVKGVLLGPSLNKNCYRVFVTESDKVVSVNLVEKLKRNELHLN